MSIKRNIKNTKFNPLFHSFKNLSLSWSENLLWILEFECMFSHFVGNSSRKSILKLGFGWNSIKLGLVIIEGENSKIWRPSLLGSRNLGLFQIRTFTLENRMVVIGTDSSNYKINEQNDLETLFTHSYTLLMHGYIRLICQLYIVYIMYNSMYI